MLVHIIVKDTRTMDMTIDQQVALDEALVPHASRLRIEKSNFRLRSDITSKESTLQLVYDILRLTPFYKAFLVTVDVPEIYMHEFWATTIVNHHSICFKMDNRKQAYKEYYAVASGAAPPKTKASVRKTKSSFDTTVTPPTAAGTRLLTSAKGKQPAKASKEKSLTVLSEGFPMYLLKSLMKKFLRNQVMKMMILMKEVMIKMMMVMINMKGTMMTIKMKVMMMINILMKKVKNSYIPRIDSLLETTSHMDVPAPTTVASLTLSAPTLTLSTIPTISIVSQAPTPPTTALSTLLIVQRYMDQRMNEAVKTSNVVAADLLEMELKKILTEKMESNKYIHRSDEQRNLYKALVEAYESDKIILDTYRDIVTLKRRRDDDADKDKEPSTGSDQGSKRQIEGKDESAPAEEPDQDEGDDDDQHEGNDDDQDTINESDEFIHPKLTIHKEEETKDEESFDLIAKTPENLDDEGNDDENLGLNVSSEEGQDAEDDEDKLYRDVNINLEGRVVQMTDVHTTQKFEDTYVTLTLANPDGQQQSSLVSSQFVTSMLNPIPDAGIDSLFKPNSQMDVPTSTTVASLTLTAPTLTPLTSPTISRVP
nr:hypothetical protein [Tanacetum cinerariifolium]